MSPLPMVMFFNDEQFEKASFYIDITLFGIVILSIEEQYSNAPSLITSIKGISIDVNVEHPEKAYLPIPATLDGMVMLEKRLSFLKA
jgi:hypothetical protein